MCDSEFRTEGYRALGKQGDSVPMFSHVPIPIILRLTFDSADS